MAFGAILGAASGIGSALLGKSASDKAAAQQARLQKQDLKLKKQQLKLVRPFVDRGDEAQNQLAIALGLQGQDLQQQFFDNFEADPGFNRAVDFGVDRVEGSLNRGGQFNSGRRLAEVANFVTTQNLNNSFQRRLDRLTGLSNAGINAAGLSGAATNAAGNTLSNIGATQAQGTIGGANALIGGIQGVANSLNFGFGGQSGNQSSGFQTTTTPTLAGLPNFISNQFG